MNLEYIKLRRKELGFTLEDMAKSLKLSNPSHYYKYEKGIYKIKIAMLDDLCRKLKCKYKNIL